MYLVYYTNGMGDIYACWKGRANFEVKYAMRIACGEGFTGYWKHDLKWRKLRPAIEITLCWFEFDVAAIVVISDPFQIQHSLEEHLNTRKEKVISQYFSAILLKAESHWLNFINSYQWFLRQWRSDLISHCNNATLHVGGFVTVFLYIPVTLC